MQNRKENVQLIVSVDILGRPVYGSGGVPALLDSSLSRLKNILKGQVVHCAEEAYNACITFGLTATLIEQNYALSENLERAYQDFNRGYLDRDCDAEIEQWLVDFKHGNVDLFLTREPFISRGFVSRIHIAQYSDCKPPAGTTLGKGELTETTLVRAGYSLESSDYEALNYRAGGPSNAKLRHTVWRHNKFPQPKSSVLSLDDPARFLAPYSHGVQDNSIQGRRIRVA